MCVLFKDLNFLSFYAVLLSAALILITRLELSSSNIFLISRQEILMSFVVLFLDLIILLWLAENSDL